MKKKIFSTALTILSCVVVMTALHAEETVRPFMPDSFEQIKASHVGKPFVVMAWSLDCTYCQESFSVLAEAKRKHQVSIVTIATDRADDRATESMIGKELAAAGLGSETWAFGSAPAEQLRYAIDPKWRGEMPRTYWFNAKGDAVGYSGAVTKDIAEKFLQR